MSLSFKCPACEGQIDDHKAVSWGTGPTEQIERLTPWICAWCGTLFVMDWKERRLLSAPQILQLYNIDMVEAMRGNKALWKEITQSQKLIKNMPGRRPVLHREHVPQ